MGFHFLDRLEHLKGHIARMTAMVQAAVEQSVDAVYSLDQNLMQQVIAGDARIDEEEVKVEQEAIALLALHQPTACDLRLITTIIKVNADFERIADCAVNIAQRVQFIRHIDNYEPPPDLRVMSNAVTSTLRDTIRAFNLGDEELAKKVVGGDHVHDALYNQIVQDMLSNMQSQAQHSTRDLSNIMMAKNLERIADHCTNIAEDVIYVHSGRIVRHTRAG